ncbi:hypothetical protein EYF80_061641 [Liparis tanakae]|uniref:Uncharacterized protein n=1 Tax=Liparis tanakae TaxID=230148 RepID=A0A4Z2EI10_9TELE|nr:hypothetical protein EYF80_061641 [Liparis tanakae]
MASPEAWATTPSSSIFCSGNRAAGLMLNSYLHDVYGHPLCGHALHIVHQPMNDLRANEAVEWEAFLLGQQLDARPDRGPSSSPKLLLVVWSANESASARCGWMLYRDTATPLHRDTATPLHRYTATGFQ